MCHDRDRCRRNGLRELQQPERLGLPQLPERGQHTGYNVATPTLTLPSTLARKRRTGRDGFYPPPSTGRSLYSARSLGHHDGACVRPSHPSFAFGRGELMSKRVILPALCLLLAAAAPVAYRADPKDAEAVIAKFKEKDPDLGKVFASARGYAVYPTVGKGGIGLGGAHGKGYVYEGGR